MTQAKPSFAVIQDAVRLACRAPSLHNSQPWRWVAETSTLHLFADFTRVMNAADPEGREAVRDGDPTLPQASPGAPPLTVEHGRGLHLINTLGTAWGAMPTSDGW